MLARTLNPPASDFPKVLTAVTQDNNVTILVSAIDFECNTRTRIIVIALIILVTIVVAYIIWRWINGRPVKITVYVTLIIAVIVIIIITIQEPECIALPDTSIEEGPRLENT